MNKKVSDALLRKTKYLVLPITSPYHFYTKVQCFNNILNTMRRNIFNRKTKIESHLQINKPWDVDIGHSIEVELPFYVLLAKFSLTKYLQITILWNTFHSLWMTFQCWFASVIMSFNAWPKSLWPKLSFYMCCTAKWYFEHIHCQWDYHILDSVPLYSKLFYNLKPGNSYQTSTVVLVMKSYVFVY